MEFKDKINQSVAAAVAKIMGEALHPNQQKLDVHEPEKDELTADDFKKLRAKKGMKKEEAEQVDEAKKESKEDFDARQKRLVAAGNETAKDPERLKKLSKIPGYSDAMNLAKKSTNEEVKDEYARKVDKYLKKKHAPDAPVKEEVELDEGTMTGITLGAKVKNKQGGYNQDVHHKGEKIGHIEAYKHRTGMRYGGNHDATGDATAGNRDAEEAIADIRFSHAQHLKDTKVKNEEVEQLDEYTPGPDGKTMIKGRAYGASKPEGEYVKGPSDAELKKIEAEKKKKPVTEEHGSAPKKRGMMGLKAYLTSKKSE